MKAILLVAFALATACHSRGGATPVRYVLRVDQVLDRSKATGGLPHDPLGDESYMRVDPRDAYAITLEGDHATIVPLDGKGGPISGRRDPKTADLFNLDAGLFAGGRLVVRGGRAEVTVYGSGVPVVSSERGALEKR